MKGRLEIHSNFLNCGVAVVETEAVRFFDKFQCLFNPPTIETLYYNLLLRREGALFRNNHFKSALSETSSLWIRRLARFRHDAFSSFGNGAARVRTSYRARVLVIKDNAAFFCKNSSTLVALLQSLIKR